MANPIYMTIIESYAQVTVSVFNGSREEYSSVKAYKQQYAKTMPITRWELCSG
jgi:hypothetical protein